MEWCDGEGGAKASTSSIGIGEAGSGGCSDGLEDAVILYVARRDVLRRLDLGGSTRPSMLDM